MNAEEILLRIEKRFPGRLRMEKRSEKRLYLSAQPALLQELVGWLRDRIEGFRLATASGIDLRDGIGVFYHFAVNGAPVVVTIKVMAPKPKPTVPSLAGALPAALWIEREIGELLGVRFEGHPDPRRLLKAREIPDDVFPLRRDFDTSQIDGRDDR